MQVKYGQVCDRLMRVLNALALGAKPEEIIGAKNDQVEVFEEDNHLYVSFLTDVGSDIHVCVKDYEDYIRTCKQARKILIYILAHTDINGVCEFHDYDMVTDGLASRESSGVRMIRDSLRLLKKIQISTNAIEGTPDLINNFRINAGKIYVEVNTVILATNMITLPEKWWNLSFSSIAAMMYLLYLKGRTDGGRHGEWREIKAAKLCEYLYINPERQKQRAEAKRFCERIIAELKEVGISVEMDQIRSMNKWLEFGKIRIKKKGI